MALFLIIPLSANASSKNGSVGPTYKSWAIMEESGGVVLPIFCGADCLARLFETFTSTGSSVSLTKHELFAYADAWAGEMFGYDLIVLASQPVYYSNVFTGASLGNVNLGTYNSNVLTDADWIWNDYYSTTTLNYEVFKQNKGVYIY